MPTSGSADFDAAKLAPPGETLRWKAPLAVGLGGLICCLSLAIIGPHAARSFADDAGVLSFLASEAAHRSPREPSHAYAPHQVARSQVARSQVARIVERIAPRFALARHNRLRPIVVASSHKRVPAHVARAAPLVTKVPAKMPELAATDTAPRVRVAAAPVSPLLDRTFRHGDAIMTDKGVRIFRGAWRYPFRVSDFAPLSRTLDVAHRGELQAIDRAAHRQDWMAAYLPLSPTLVRRDEASLRDMRTIRRIGGLAIY
jgi:hypothetical protein